MPAARKTRSGAIKINGVRIKPRWDWTPDYAEHVREVLRDSPSPRSKADKDAHLIKRAAAYARWIAARDGRSDVPDHADWIEIDDGHVIFATRYRVSGGSFYGQSTIWEKGEELARVSIPNLNWRDPYEPANESAAA